ncbi:hypothetical protein LguiA_024260 [Lonicera macranthoides]
MMFFHPLHSQLELGSSNVHNPVAITGNLSNDQDEMQFENGTTAVDVTNFLDSVLLSSDEHSSEDYHINMISTVESESPKYINSLERVYVEDSRLCRESGGPVAEGQLGPGYSEGGFYMDNIAPLHMETASGAYVTPDSVNNEERRNMGFLQNRPDYLSTVSDGNQSYNLFNSVEEQQIHISTVMGGDNFGSGVRIRHRQPRIQSPQHFVSQGNASRRLRLQIESPIGSRSAFCSLPKEPIHSEENSELKPTDEAEKDEEKHTPVGASIDNTQEKHSLRANSDEDAARGSLTAKSKCDSPPGDSNVEATPAFFSVSSRVYVPVVLVALGLFVVGFSVVVWFKF